MPYNMNEDPNIQFIARVEAWHIKAVIITTLFGAIMFMAIIVAIGIGGTRHTATCKNYYYHGMKGWVTLDGVTTNLPQECAGGADTYHGSWPPSQMLVDRYLARTK